MPNNPLNPATNQPFSPKELADIAVNKINAQYSEAPYTSGIVRTPTETIANKDNNYADYSTSGYQVGDDNPETRAQLQSWHEQLGNSFVKMGTTAATTFLDGTVGLAVGALNVIGGDKDQNALNRFISNPFTNAMVDFQDKMETNFGNYRTHEEENNNFLQNAFSLKGAANFWGDNVIKNLGFAIGAMGSGMVTSLIGDVALGITTISKTSKVLEGIAKTIQEGGELGVKEKALIEKLAVSGEDLASLKNEKILNELHETASQIKSKTAINQALSAFVGSVGEARLEAIGDSREFKNAHMMDLQAKRDNEEITNEEFSDKADNLDKEVQGYQNGLFAANVALLSLSNYVQFKNAFTRGYTPTKVMANEVANIAETGASKGLYELAAKSRIDKAVDFAALLKNPLSEMTEEQLQFAAQRTFDNYYNLKTDDEANATVQNAISSVGKGLAEAYGTEEGWQNAFGGLIIGALGIPTIGKRSSGKTGLKIEGGIYGEYKEQQHANETFKKNVDTANSLIKNGITQKLYDATVVDNALEQKGKAAVDINDRMNAKTINAMQLANMVDAFTAIGKYDDFVKRIEDETSLSAPELREKYKQSKTDFTGAEKRIDFFKGMTDDQVTAYVKKKAENTIKEAERVKILRQDIDVRFSGHSEDARKDLLINAAAVSNIDNRIDKLLNEIKVETGESFFRALNKNFTPEMIQHISDFSGLTTPTDLEQFLKKKKGLENYERLIKEYIAYQSNPEKAAQFAEKARDLYGLIGSRQTLNDTYFKMADERYAANQDALNQTAREEKEVGGKARSLRNKMFAEAHFNEDPEFGEESTIFEASKGTVDTLTVKGVDRSTGATVTLENARPDDTNPKHVDENGNAIIRTSSKGVKFGNYKAIRDGKEVSVELVNPVETKSTKEDKARLVFRKVDGVLDPNNLYDEEGNAYALEDLMQDPTFMASSEVTRAAQRQAIYDKVRIDTLNKLISSNSALQRNLREQIDAIKDTITTTEELLVRAKANKSGRIRINGTRAVATVFQLENALIKYKEQIDKLNAQREELGAETIKAIESTKEVKAGNFNREIFNTVIKENVAALQKQIKEVQDSKDMAEAQVERLEEVIKALKATLKVIYPRFKKLYQDIYGVDPTTVSNIMVKWQTDITPLLRALRADEADVYMNLRVEEKDLDAILQQIKQIQAALNPLEKLATSLNNERTAFEKELARVLEIRRATQQGKTVSAKTTRSVSLEIDDSQDAKVSSHISAKPSIEDAFKTAGKDVMYDGKENPNPAQQRWSKAVSKITLGAGKFALRVVTAKQRPDLFIKADKAGNMVPMSQKEMDGALAVILYKDGKPIDGNLQPLGEDAKENELVYNFIPLPTLTTTDVNGKTFERFYDAASNPAFAASQMAKLQDLRDTLFARADENKPSFLPITGKSLGLLETTGQKRSADKDLTTAVWDTLLGNTTNEKKGSALSKSRIEVAKATNDEDVQAGWGYITVGKESVKVKNGLAYFITENDVVVPLLSRKLTSQEVETTFNLLTALTNNAAIGTTAEAGTAIAAAAAASPIKGKKKAKGKTSFKPLGKDKKRAQVALNKINAKRKFDKYKLYFDKATGQHGYYQKVTLTKEEADKIRAAKGADSIDIFSYLKDLIYFGRQDKAEDSLISAHPNPQTQIFLADGNLHFFDFSKNTSTSIPFTAESLEANKEALLTFLENKYHQISNNKLGKQDPHRQITKVIFDEEGKPLHVEVETFTSYFSYLITNKGGARNTNEIPLTTNASTDKDGNLIVRSTYLKYSGEPGAIKETAEAPKKAYTPPPAAAPTPKAATPKASPVAVSEAKTLLTEVEKLITDGPYELASAIAILTKVANSKELLAYYEKASFEEDEFSELTKKDPALKDEYEAYTTFLTLKNALNAYITDATTVTSEETTTEGSALDSLAEILTASGDIDVEEDEDEEGEITINGEEGEEEGASKVDRRQQTGGPVIDIPAALTWLQKALPQVSKEIHKKLIDGVAQGRITTDGILHLSEMAEEGTEYHEALHEVMLGILSDDELKEVYKEAERLYGVPTNQDLQELKKIYPKLSNKVLASIFYDEKLAEDFRTYGLSKGKIYPSGILGKAFQKLIDAIKAFLGLRPSGAINGMFYDLYNGHYANKTYSTTKVAERIKSKFRDSRLKWSVTTKTGTRPVDILTSAQFTKETINAVLGNLFKGLLYTNNSIADLSTVTIGEFNSYIEDALRRTKEDLTKSPVTAHTKVLTAFLETPAGKAQISKVVKEYVQNDLGVELGLYKEEEENELDKTSTDNAWSKDNSTIHPREGTNSFVKLMIASLTNFERNAAGDLQVETGDLLGLPMLVKPNAVFNHLLSLLHTCTSFNDVKDTASMVAVLQKNVFQAPYLQQLLDLLTDKDALKRDSLGFNNLITNFQQSMYKAALNYKLWLVNEGDVVVTDPNSESLQDRTIEFWRANLVENLNTAGSIIIKPKDASLPRISSIKVKEILKTVKSPKHSFTYYMEVLNKLGFTIGVTDPSEYTNAEAKIFIDNAKPFIEELTKTTKDGQERDLDYVFNKQAKSRLFNIATIAAARNPDITDLQHIGPDGKTRYGISEHNMISMIADYINSLPEGTPISKLLGRTGMFSALQSDYIGHSHFIQNVLFTVGEDRVRRRTSVPFKVGIIEGARPNSVGAEGNVNTKSDKVDRTWMSFNSILKGIFPVLRTSDKALEYSIDMSSAGEQSKWMVTPGTINSKKAIVSDIFLGYLIDELKIGKSEGGSLIANFAKNKGDGTYFFKDILSDGGVPSILPSETIEEYVTKNEDAVYKALEKYFVKHDAYVIERLLETGLVETESTKTGTIYTLKALDKGIIELFEKESNSQISKTEEGVRLNAEKFESLIRAFTVNSLMGNIEQTKMFFGHPAFYKDAVTLYKRTAGAVGTKKQAIVDQRMNNFLKSLPLAEKDGKINKDGTVEVIVLQEPNAVSVYYNQIYEAFKEKFKNSAKAKLLADKYVNIEEADGQGYITLPEYREFRIRIGEWGRTEESLYHRAMRGEKINPSEIITTFNVLKAQYFGLNKIDDLTVPVYLKFSLMPLLPSIYAGSNMESIAESMMKNGQGIAVFPSGIKVGALMQEDGEYYPMYDDTREEGAFDGNAIASNANVLNLDYRFMGIQVATSTSVKEKSPRGSQQSKIIVADRYEEGTAQPITVYKEGKPKTLSAQETHDYVQEYYNTVNAITKAKTKELLEEIGAKNMGNGTYKITDVTKLASALKRAARNRNSPDNLIDSLQTIKEGDEVRFKYLLDGVPNRNKIETILFSIINNNVISQDYYGGTRIQAAATGFEKEPRRYDFKNGKTLLKSNPALRFYTKGKYGETLPAQVKLTPNKEMLDVINKLGGIQAVNEKLKLLWALSYNENGDVEDGTRYDEAKVKELFGDISPEIFQFVAYRIPTQGMNTIEHLEIAEFLDPLAGEAIHLPSELVAKSGGDYDIDKLNVYFKQVDKEGQLINDTSIKGLQNKLIKINQDFLAAPENLTDLLMPNDPSTLKKLAGDEVPVSSTESLTWGFNLDTAEAYLVGKAAVGIIARHRTHHTLTQAANVIINQKYKGGFGKDKETSSNLNFVGSEDNYSLGKIFDSVKNHKIGDIISEFLSSFVDVAKDPFIFRLNASTNTADLYMYLVRRGVPVEVATKFMTQPIIIEYYKRLAGGKSMVNTVNGTDLSNFDIQKQLKSLLTSAYEKVGGDINKIKEKSFTEEELANHVGKTLTAEHLKDITFIREQAQVLNDFIRYAEQANNLRALMDATSDDTTRHKNFNSLDNYNKRMELVTKSAMFDAASVQRIFDNTLVGGFQEAQKLHELNRELFVTEHPKIKTSLDYLRDYLNTNGVTEDNANTVLDKVKNDLIIHMISSTTNRAADILKSLFLGSATNLSTAEKIAKTLKSPNPAITKNPFFKALIPLLENPRSNVKGLKMFNVKLTTFDFNQLVNGFNAINNENLKKELAAFILLQSGLDNSPISWYDKIPVDTMHAIIEKSILNFKDNMQNFDTDHFMHEFIRNNYMNYDLVPTIGVYYSKGGGNIIIDKQGILKSDVKKRHTNRLFVKVRAEYPEYADKDKAALAKAAGLVTGEYLLFAKRPDGSFQLINKRGDKMNMKEFKGANSPSILNANNVDTGIFRESFPTWAEPELPALPKGESLPSQGEALQTQC